MQKNTFCLHFWHFGRHLIQLFHFSAACCNKIDRTVGQLCNHKHGDAFSIHWQQYR